MNIILTDSIKRKFKILFLIFSVFLFLGANAIGCPFLKNNSVPADGGVFKSDDGGLTWQRKIVLTPPSGSNKSAGDISSVNILTVAVDQNDNNIVYAGTEGNGFLRSSDKGETWAIYNGQNMLATETIYDIAIDPKDSKKMYAAGISAEGKGRVLKSEDGGENWEQTYVTLAAGNLVSKISIDFYDTGIVYIATSQDGIFQSVNYGRSWTLLCRFAGGINNMIISPADTRIIYVTSLGEGLLKSTDKGVNWISLVDKLKAFNFAVNTKIDSIAVDPQNSNILYLGYLDGMLRTYDGGATWEKINILTPPAIIAINSIGINASNTKNIYYTINSQVYLTGSIGASNWIVRDLPTTRVLQALTIDQKDPNIIYAGSRYVRKR